MKENDIVTLKIIGYGINGEGIAKQGEYVFFVPFAVKDEIIKAKVKQIKKNLVFAELLDVFEKSPERQEPICPYFSICGGCNLMHIYYENQLKIKTEALHKTLMKQIGVGYEIKPCIASNKITSYRNKVEFPVYNDKIGFYEEKSHKIVEINDCKLCDSWCKDFLEIARKCLNNNNQIKFIVVRELTNQGEKHLCVTLVTQTKQKINVDKWITLLKEKFKDFSIFQNINEKKSSEVFGEKFICLYGKEKQKIIINNLKFEVSPYSFLQINEYIQNKIYQKTIEFLDENSVVINGYSGAGLLSALLSKKAEKIIGIEINPDATNDANQLAICNKITNMQNICGDCAKVLGKLVEKNQNKTVNFVVDPNRKGLDKKVIDTILNCKPSKIIYISCNPATLARDLKFLVNDYKISFIQPYDMFPQTKHLETLVLLNKK